MTRLNRALSNVFAWLGESFLARSSSSKSSFVLETEGFSVRAAEQAQA